MPHSSRSIRRLYFTDLQQAKTCSKKNISLRHILDILLKFRKFQAQYPCKVYFYVKREISATNHVVCNVFVLIALAASGLEKEIGILVLVFLLVKLSMGELTMKAFSVEQKAMNQ